MEDPGMRVGGKFGGRHPVTHLPEADLRAPGLCPDTVAHAGRKKCGGKYITLPPYEMLGMAFKLELEWIQFFFTARQPGADAVL